MVHFPHRSNHLKMIKWILSVDLHSLFNWIYHHSFKASFCFDHYYSCLHNHLFLRYLKFSLIAMIIWIIHLNFIISVNLGVLCLISTTTINCSRLNFGYSLQKINLIAQRSQIASLLSPSSKILKRSFSLQFQKLSFNLNLTIQMILF